MPERLNIQAINEMSEVFILFGLATLYCCACPIVPVIVMFNNILDINLDLFVNYSATRRPIAQLDTNINPWLSIAEFMALAAVISNCLLLYFSTQSLHTWVNWQFFESNYEEVYLLWILIISEHVIILIKYLVSALIPDVPIWVNTSLTRITRD